MIYTWKDRKSNLEVTVDRKMSEYEVPPRLEETLMDPTTYLDADWVRLVTGGSAHIGFGFKGRWAQHENHVKVREISDK